MVFFIDEISRKYYYVPILLGRISLFILRLHRSQDESTQLALLSCISSIIQVLGDAVTEAIAAQDDDGGVVQEVGVGVVAESRLAPRLFHLIVTVEALSRSANVQRRANETLSQLAQAEV